MHTLNQSMVLSIVIQFLAAFAGNATTLSRSER